MDKAPKQPMTRSKHAQTQTSIIKHAMTNATLLLTRVTPNDCEIRRGSGCPWETPCLNPGLSRWQTRCLCQMHRGHWPNPLPSSSTLDGGVRVPQLGAERLDLSLCSQQADTQLHRHVLVVYHLHPRDILLHPKGLEHVLLPLGQEVVDAVL
jgi:hypothetical protein